MGKGHRHLKKLKSEKAKVKLKGSKQLPKGTNVTDTNFKIKQIIVPEQLKLSNDAEPLSKRKLNIKELLTRLQHYNTTVKSGAITDLKEIVSLYPQDVVFPNLNQLINGVSHLVLDKEKTVRQDALKLIALILSQVSVEQITPFFDILGSYFRCAVTHIDTAIQEDSLLLLDILLTHVPSLVALHSNKILDNFFDLISKLRSDSKLGRTLTLNLGSKLTTVKWRIKVLNRLYSILDAIVKNKENNNKENTVYTNSIDYSVKHTYYPVNQTFSTCLISLNEVKNKTNIEENNIVKNIDILVPLLFETWLEVGPNGEENNELDVTLTDEACAVLNCILNIFYLLHTFLQAYGKEIDNYDLVKKFVTTYRKNFSKYIITYFPYTKILSKKRKRNEKNNSPTGPSFCTLENLMICNLFCIFNSKISSENKQRENAEKITNYIQNIFMNYNSENIDNKFAILLLRNLLLQVSWSCCKNDLVQILNTVLNMYASNKTESAFKQELFNILCELVNNKTFNNFEEFQKWMNTLPDLLCQKEVNVKTVNMILLLAKQNNVAFNNILKVKFANILENIGNIKINNTKHEIITKYKIISLMQYITKENIFDFIKIMSECNCEDSLKKYFQEIAILMFEEKFDTKSANKIRH